MPENKTVIVATDGSDHSLRILPHAQALASALSAPMRFVRVIEQDELKGEENGQRAELTSRMQQDLQRFGITGEIDVVVAPEGKDPAETLLDLGAQGAILAMHSRGRGGIARLLQGSVSMSVIKKVTQPVMLGGPELLSPPEGRGPFRLLAATDLSPDADHALRAVAPLLAQGSFEVTLLNVHLQAPRGIDNEAQRAEHEAALKEKRQLLPESVPVVTRLREIPIGGGIDTAIMEEAGTVDAQAILMATHGHSARRQLLMGSVALSVLGRSRLPLIVARAQG